MWADLISMNLQHTTQTNSAESLCGLKLARRAFLRPGVASTVGNLPLWNATPAQAADIPEVNFDSNNGGVETYPFCRFLYLGSKAW
jgi:hypothetical protein